MTEAIWNGVVVWVYQFFADGTAVIRQIGTEKLFYVPVYELRVLTS